MKYCKTQKKQSGLTLVESLLVLAVAALVAVLAYGGYKMANLGVKSQSGVESTVRLLTSIKKTFGSSGDYTGITGAVVKSSGVVPSDFDISTGFKAPYGSAVSIASAASNKMAAVTFAAVPADICMDLVSGIEGMTEVLTVGGDTAKDLTADPQVKYKASVAAAKCGAGTSDVVASVK